MRVFRTARLFALLALPQCLILSTAETACERGVPCIIGKGSDTFDNSEVIPTAVGCTRTVDVRFRPFEGNASVEIEMCEFDSQGQCVYRPGVVLNDFQRECCQKPFQSREAACLGAGQEHAPLSIFQCIQVRRTEHGGGEATAHVTFVAPFQGDLSNGGQAQACVRGRDAASGAVSRPYCLLFHIQRCARCLQEGQGLTGMAKEVGTHWTQIYSANPEMRDNPDWVGVGELVRVGSLYRVQPRDTLAAIALRFGVTVNQLYYWNQHLVPLPDNGGVGPNAFLSRQLPAGLELCVSPKTCLDSFGPRQPLYYAGDGEEEGGGGWADPPQVIPHL
mmetsp:Transcript_5607/g.13101  ORF Transcript_5607/g.13101 Transcript_5607/m.13101 type:complete len:333 (+) Transcript_5607:158-1156(+)